ncbi:sensor histidine kinase [Caenimonas terrae]|uniref:Oxygen sensor histidine kinase NreB n=1 Tax=Caenimonas terrae TaxID=696074 RepID=A0ABW0NHD9_9BURK
MQTSTIAACPAAARSSQMTAAPPSPDTTPGQLASQLQGAREQARAQEREHLAREFHDVLGGLLTAARLDIASLQARLGGHDAEVDRRLAHLNDTLRAAFALKRRIVDGLAPASLHGVGLTASLEAMVREFVEASGIRVSTYLDNVVADEATQLAIYRLVQESLTNIAKYADARAAEIMLRNRGNTITVVVSDDGQGFEAGQARPGGHGLEGMRHRVESVGGQFTVDSARGRGTRVSASLPKVPGPGATAH